MLGERKYSVPVLINSKEGYVDVYEEGLVVNVPGSSRRIIIPKGYFYSLEEVRMLPLGKKQARMIAYEYTGNKNEIDMIISEHHFSELKKLEQGLKLDRVSNLSKKFFGPL